MYHQVKIIYPLPFTPLLAPLLPFGVLTQEDEQDEGQEDVQEDGQEDGQEDVQLLVFLLLPYPLPLPLPLFPGVVEDAVGLSPLFSFSFSWLEEVLFEFLF